MQNLKLTFIGAGKMAEAILKGILSAKLLAADNITMTDINEVRLQQLKKDYGVNTGLNNPSSVDGVDIVLLAIKPQQAEKVLNEIRPFLSNKQLILSIMAGITLSTIDKNGNLKVTRLMPNTPALIGQSMTVISYNPRVEDKDKKIIEQIFSSIGQTMQLPENLLNSVTAVSGSGPAIVFRLLEACIFGAMDVGIPYTEAKQLVLQTFKGSTMLAQQSEQDLQQLVLQVSSPGGTTIAGRNILENSSYKQTIKDTIIAAKNRADELSEEK